MDVFVTGATGTIGSAVIRQLLSDGCSVIALARSEASAENVRALGASAFPGDLRNPEGWVERAATCDSIVHTGATFTDDMAIVDRKAMLALQKAVELRQTRVRLIYTGGIWLYPPANFDEPIRETTPFSPVTAFAWMSETIRSLTQATRLGLAVIHPAIVCTQGKGPVAGMAAAAERGTAFETRASTDTIWPLVTAQELARLYSAVLQLKTFRVSLIGASLTGVRVGDLAARIGSVVGTTPEVKTIVPTKTQETRTDWSAGYARSQVVNPQKAIEITSWRPQLTKADAFIDALLPDRTS